jgi:hypothetical protein
MALSGRDYVNDDGHRACPAREPRDGRDRRPASSRVLPSTCCGNDPRAPRVYVPGHNGSPIEPRYNAPKPFFAPRQAPSPMLQRRVVP